MIVSMMIMHLRNHVLWSIIHCRRLVNHLRVAMMMISCCIVCMCVCACDMCVMRDVRVCLCVSVDVCVLPWVPRRSWPSTSTSSRPTWAIRCSARRWCAACRGLRCEDHRHRQHDDMISAHIISHTHTLSHTHNITHTSSAQMVIGNNRTHRWSIVHDWSKSA